jgi:YD repeat-containing protein
LSACSTLFANVSLRNGNFFIDFTDLSYSGGFDLKIERVYNSKSSFRGIFGPGWGTEYEVYLAILADGSVLVHEYGGGADNLFVPAADSGDLDSAIDAIAAGEQKTDLTLTGQRLVDYKTKLRTEAEFRAKEWERLLAARVVTPRELPVGTRLTSNRFSYQYIIKTLNGYRRTFDNGRMEDYDPKGRLIRISDRNGNWIELSYKSDDENRRPTLITDNLDHKIQLTYNDRGLVQTADGVRGQKPIRAIYKYNQRDELVYSRDVDGNAYAYQYDAAGRSDLVAIGYSDGTVMAMTYYSSEEHENIRSVEDRDGGWTTYMYTLRTPLDYEIRVEDHGSSGKLLSTSKHHYYLKREKDGEEWTYRMITDLDGYWTDTTYDECCGLPIRIETKEGVTSFEYDDKGRVTRKETAAEITKLKYEEQIGKVVRVEKHLKSQQDEGKWYDYGYDDKGNLTKVTYSEGKGGSKSKTIKLTYDDHGRIETMNSGEHTMRFAYNKESKPSVISIQDIGAISVSYSEDGSIQAVRTITGTAGGLAETRVSLEITRIFQELLDAIRPAGVGLTPGSGNQ